MFRAEKSMNVVARWDFCGHFPLEFRLFSRFTNVSAPFKMSRSVTSIESKDQVSQPRIFPSIFIYEPSPRRKKKSWQFWPKANQSLPIVASRKRSHIPRLGFQVKNANFYTRAQIENNVECYLLLVPEFSLGHIGREGRLRTWNNIMFPIIKEQSGCLAR